MLLGILPDGSHVALRDRFEKDGRPYVVTLIESCPEGWKVYGMTPEQFGRRFEESSVPNG